MSQTVAITLSGLIALVHLHNGGLALVDPRAGKVSHIANLEYADNSSGHRTTVPLDGITIAFRGMPQSATVLDDPRAWSSSDCPATVDAGEPKLGTDQYDWSVDMRCLNSGKTWQIPKAKLSDPKFVSARLDLVGTTFHVKSTELASTDAGNIVSRFQPFSGHPSPRLYQATADKMEITFDIDLMPGDPILIDGYDANGTLQWTKKAFTAAGAMRYDLTFANDTDAKNSDCAKTIVGNLCVAMSQRHFMLYYDFFGGGNANASDLPWPGKYARLASFLEADPLWGTTPPVVALQAALKKLFGQGILQAGGGGHPICMMASFQEQ